MSDAIFGSTVIGVAALTWCGLGLWAYRTLAKEELPRALMIALPILCGPLAVMAALVACIGALRRRILAHFGFADQSCCGGHEHSGCTHGEPVVTRERGHSNQKGRRRGAGYPTDLLSNHPSIRG